MKVHYPIEFWSVTFSRAKAEDYPYYINEIRRSGNIQIKSVDINQSGANIVSDVKSNSIYWAFNSVSQLGDVAQQELMEERTKMVNIFLLMNLSTDLIKKVLQLTNLWLKI